MKMTEYLSTNGNGTALVVEQPVPAWPPFQGEAADEAPVAIEPTVEITADRLGELLRASQELADFRDTVAEVNAALVAARTELDEVRAVSIDRYRDLIQARREHEDFRQRVINRARQCKVDQDWCTPGFNAAMEELGLPAWPDRYRGTVTVTLDVDVRNAGSEDVARDWIYSVLRNSHVPSNDSDVEFSIDDYSVGDLEPQHDDEY